MSSISSNSDLVVVILLAGLVFCIVQGIGREGRRERGREGGRERGREGGRGEGGGREGGRRGEGGGKEGEGGGKEGGGRGRREQGGREGERERERGRERGRGDRERVMKKERDDSFSCVAAIICTVHVNCTHNYYFIPRFATQHTFKPADQIYNQPGLFQSR